MINKFKKWWSKHEKCIFKWINIIAGLVAIIGLPITIWQVVETKNLAYLDINTSYYIKNNKSNDENNLNKLRVQPDIKSGKVKATYMAKVSDNKVKIKDISNKNEIPMDFFRHKNGLNNGQDYIGGYIVYVNASDNQQYFDYLYWIPIKDYNAVSSINGVKSYSNLVNTYERSGSRSIEDEKMLDESMTNSKIKETEKNMNFKSSDSPVNANKILVDRKKIHDYLKEYFD